MSLISVISKTILRMAGWKTFDLAGEPSKSVICVAPHTSNWDFVIGKLFYLALNRKSFFLIKNEWFFFPFNILFKAMGGIPVDRKKRLSITHQVAEEFKRRDSFHVAVTPEGTRKPVESWKRGFYYIAVKANVPIVLAFIDYSKKECGFFKLFHPTGDTENDIKYIKSLYKDVTGYYPENFII